VSIARRRLSLAEEPPVDYDCVFAGPFAAPGRTGQRHCDDDGGASMILRHLVICCAGCCGLWLQVATARSAEPTADRVRELLNGRDLEGWIALGHFDPRKWQAMTADERQEMINQQMDDLTAHWRVEDGELINDGSGPYLTTADPYGDIELWIDFKIAPLADSGIYLRGTPQVQIWDTTKEGGKWNLGADKGSGSLWNNKRSSNQALVHADRPLGEWNRFHIRMIGPYTTVYLNDQLVVDNLPLENFWDPSAPLFPRGPIQLQTHGGEIRFRNIRIREIGAEESNRVLQQMGDEGFTSVFNGRNLEGWIGNQAAYVVQDGVLACRPGSNGYLFLEKPLSDFAVRFEFRLPPGGNNGLAIRSPLEGDPAYAGMEIQILDDTHEKYHDLKPWQFHGSVYGIAPSRSGFLRPVGEWNYEEVIVQGPHVSVALNGTVITEADLDALEPLDGRAHPGRTRREGHLGFMGHGDAVELRHIRVKEL
jgi:hypothetical protein